MVINWCKRLGVSWAGMLLTSLVGITLGLSSYTFWYGEGLSYFSNDPAACANCHIMRDHLSSWQKGSHHAHATCNDCHVPHDFFGKWLSKASNGFWHSKGFTLQDFPEPIRITSHNAGILQHNCIDCHDGAVHQLTPVTETGAVKCVHCHAHVGHGPQR